MVSFDINFLYTNIPITDMLNIIKDYVFNDDQYTRKTAIPEDKFLDLVNLVLVFSFINKLMALQWDDQHLQPQQKSIWRLMNILQYLRHYTLQNFENDLLLLTIRLCHSQTYAIGKLFLSHQQSSSKH